MTKAKETLCTNHATLPPEKRPRIESPFILENQLQPKVWHTFLWVSKQDHLPFYAGVGSDFQAYEMVHKVSGGKWAVQQMYRASLKDNFLCLFVDRDTTEHYAYSLLHYLYSYFTNQPCPTNTDALFTMKPLTWLPEPCTSYTVLKPFFPLPSSSPEQIRIREYYKSDLRNRLVKQRTNNRIYDKYRNEKQEAIAILTKALQEGSIPAQDLPRPPVRP